MKLFIFASQLHVKSLYLGYIMQKVLPMSFRVFYSLSSSCSRRRRRPSFPDGIRTKRKCKKKGKSDLKRNMSSAESTQTTLISDADKRKREEEFGQTQRDDQKSKTVGLQINIKWSITSEIPRDLSTRLLTSRRGK